MPSFVVDKRLLFLDLKACIICCQFMSTHAYQFWSILIFNKMALIFLGVLIVFTVSSFEFQQVRLPGLHR